MSSEVLINIKDLSVSYLHTHVVKGLSLSVAAGETVALMGPNGSGKSTLLKVIRSQVDPGLELFDPLNDHMHGSITLPRGLRAVWLPQNLRAEWHPPERPEYDKASARARLKQAFGFDTAKRPVQHLSDGQLQKLAIIETVAAEAELFLLDEPTNYLDLDGLQALEYSLLELSARGCSLLLVTHDRALTESVADRTYYLSANGVYQSEGGFSRAWSLAGSEYQARRKEAADIKRRMSVLRQDYQRRAGWSRRKEESKRGSGSAKPSIGKQAKKMAQRAQAVNRRVERELVRLEQAKPFVPKSVNLAFDQYDVARRTAFHLQNASFRYGEDSPWLIRDARLTVSTREKICLMGANGAGKTTLLRLLSGELAPTCGEVYVNKGVNLRHLPQGLAGFFGEETLLDNFRDCGDQTIVRQHLGSALLRRDKVIRPVDDFSHGELMRAAVVRCILQRAEFLLLDEPTSHLDIESIEVLERLLSAFQGGFLLISHDRRFVEHVADKLYLLGDARIRLI